jgi:hypothetical protein
MVSPWPMNPTVIDTSTSGLTQQEFLGVLGLVTDPEDGTGMSIRVVCLWSDVRYGVSLCGRYRDGCCGADCPCDKPMVLTGLDTISMNDQDYLKVYCGSMIFSLENDRDFRGFSLKCQLEREPHHTGNLLLYPSYSPRLTLESHG